MTFERDEKNGKREASYRIAYEKKRITEMFKQMNNLKRSPYERKETVK